MNDEELKQLWHQQELAPPLKVTDTELIDCMKKKMKKFDRDISRRDWRELGACAIAFGAFFYLSLRHPPALSLAGCVVIMLSCVFIAWRLIAARRAHPTVPETASTSDFLRAEIVKVVRQMQLLQTVLWWYLLPLFIGLELFELGFHRPDGELFSMLLFNLAIFGFIYWANLRGVRKYFMPLKQELENMLNSVAESPPKD
jgi:F0F1-type ATP synthase assembly protein I